LSTRFKFYKDSGLNIPVKRFKFGKINAGERRLVPFYLRNEGLVPIDNVILSVQPTPIFRDGEAVPTKLMVTLETSSKISRLKPQEVYDGIAVVTAFESAKAGDAGIEISVEGIINKE